MSINIFPTTVIPSYGYKSGLDYKTLVFESASGSVEQAIYQRRFPKTNFGNVFQNITPEEADTLKKFVIGQMGMSTPFWYIDWEDREWTDIYVGRGGPPPIGAIQENYSAVYTNQTVNCIGGLANGMNLFPATPAQHDAYYFGSITPFDKLTLTIGTPGVGTWTITWEFWNGSAWTALAGVSDGTTGFTAAAGAREVTFTLPVTWVINSVSSIEAYWIRARVSAYTSKTVIPLGSGASLSSKTYDLHGLTTSAQKIYIDGVLKTVSTHYSIASGGGAAGADRLTLVDYPAIGSLITSDFTGHLRIKGRFKDDSYQENYDTYRAVVVNISIYEVQW